MTGSVARTTAAALLAILLFLPVLSVHFRNLLWSRTIGAV